MAIKLERIYYNLRNKYRLKLLAGKDGLYDFVEWVHTVENFKSVSYLRNNELVITTGIAMDADDSLFVFCTGLKERGVSGLVVNVGPYIKSISKEVIDHCEEINLPLIALPWEMQLTDFGRDLHRMVLQIEKFEETIVEAFRDAIFIPNSVNHIIPILEREGFSANTKYTIILFEMVSDGDEESKLDNVKRAMKRIVGKRSERFVLFLVKEVIVLVLVDLQELAKEQLSEELTELCKVPNFSMVSAINPSDNDIMHLSQNYIKTEKMLRFAKRTHKIMVRYEELDIYKILLSVDDPSVLREMYQNKLEKLDRYDFDYGTNYYQLLKAYYRYSFNKTELANKLFIHRNTVQYQLGKIEEILDCDFKNSEDLLKIFLCIYIKDVI